MYAPASSGLRSMVLRGAATASSSFFCLPRARPRSLYAKAPCPVCASHTFTVSSLLPDTRRLPVGGEHHTGNFGGVPLEGERLLSGVRVPHLQRPVRARRHDAGAVG